MTLLNRLIYKPLLLLLSLLLAASGASSQGWYEVYPHSPSRSTWDVAEAVLGGYVVVGSIEDPTAPSPNTHNLYIFKTNATGVIQWEKQFGSFNEDNLGLAIERTVDGGYILGGTSEGSAWLVRIDSVGNLLWEKAYNAHGFRALCITHGGGFAFSTYEDVFLVDANGIIQWTFAPSNPTEWNDLALTAGDGFIYAQRRMIAGQVKLVKLTPNGIKEREFIVGLPDFYLEEIEVCNDGGYAMVGNAGGRGYAFKVDSLGVQQWGQFFAPMSHANLFSIEQTNDADLVICGRIDSAQQGLLLLKTSPSGLLQWQREIHLVPGTEAGHEVIVNSLDGYVVTGANTSAGTAFLLGIDSTASWFTNEIQGRVFGDYDANCLLDSADIGLAGWQVMLGTSNSSFFTTTDSTGIYTFSSLDTGSYTLSLTPPSAPTYWQINCQNQVGVNFSNSYEADTVDFPVESTANCPLMTVSTAAHAFRPCMGTDISFQYCNNGTMPANHAAMIIKLPPLLQADWTNVPYNYNALNSHTFLVDLGNVPMGGCGTLVLPTMVDCDAVIGQAVCVDAEVFPDAVCFPLDTAWDGSYVKVSGMCLGDSVKFTIANVGASMTGDGDYVVIEDMVMRTAGTFQLQSGQELSFTEATYGKTLRLEADQAPFHPYAGSFDAISVEACTTDSSFTTGFVTVFPQSDFEPFHDIFCLEVTASYDPNDKQGFPIGYDTPHYIEANQALEYLIRFQNTGNDTAFNVVIRDTLTALLDPSTIQVGASSHAYTWRMEEDSILIFSFNDIMLPDSATNEDASKGFVKFDIQQQHNNPLGSVIRNEVAIYFDFNPPIFTNQAWHTIGSDFVRILTNVEDELIDGVEVNVRPNPFQEQAILQVSGKEFRSLRVEVLDIQGKRLMMRAVNASDRIILEKGQLKAGIYLYRLWGDERLIDTGKMIIYE